MHGYSPQAVVGDGQIVLVAEISAESLDTANLEPIIRPQLQELEAVGVSDTPEVVLADAGYRKNDAVEALCGDGHPDPHRPRRRPTQGAAARAPWRPLRHDFTGRALATEWGKQLYLRR